MRKLFLTLSAIFLLLINAMSQRTLTGKVTGSDGSPLQGATVEANDKSATVTAEDGTYSIKVSSNARRLLFTLSEYASEQRTIGSSTVINVSLTSNQRNLQEVVVVGYGTQKRKEVTGNIASVSGKAIAEMPVQSFEQALGGKAAGVQITIPNGVLNNPPVIRIRGTNSISLSSYPLIVVDGVPSFTGDNSATSAAGNALASINPNDIESIDIAKDAAASAIYGSRAANGVIFITTKKGRQGKTQVHYDGWVGWTTAQRLPELLNAQEYTDIKNEALRNAGTYNASTNYFALTNDATGNPINTRWYDYVYRQGISHSHNVNVSGANESTNYYFSLGYTAQQGILQKNDFKRISALGNFDQKINKFLSAGGKISYSNELNLAAASSGSLPGEAFATAGLGRAAVLIAPNVSPYNLDGSYNFNPTNGLIGVMGNKTVQVGFYNPVPSLALNRQNSESNHLQGNTYLQLKPFQSVTLKTTFGIDYLFTDNEIFGSGLTGEGFLANSPGGNATSTYSKAKRWIWSNTAQFDHTFGEKHTIGILIGNEQQKTNSVGFGLNRTTVSDPFYTNIQGGFLNIFTAGTAGNIGENYLLSEFGRLQYNYNKKYFISGNIRKDGASQLGATHKYGTFWGVGVAWEVAREEFWNTSKLNNVFSSFKLRGSYGRVGNIAGLSNFGTLSTFSAGLYGGNPTLVFTNAGNPDLQWETSTKTDVGLSFGILKDKITADIAYYRNNIDGLILGVQQPPSAGLPNSINTNVGTMYNKGIEVGINTNLISKKDFSWNSSFNIAYNKNEVTSLAPGLPQLLTT
ncbi:MAG: SusC/RagA family TonB-linked outer membrane protein, partial [Bacteroidota bacterium]|nr:SusC/RagA family TonB-linked outer membrane protein [Bacteroidota bacterium]